MMNKYYEYEELERLFGGNSRIQATLEQTCHFAGKDSEPENARFFFGNKESLLGHVVQRAKELGTWIEKIDDFLESHGYTVDMDDIWFNGQYEASR